MSSMPPPSPPPGWGRTSGGPPAGGTSAEHPNGTTVLVLGILSLVVCGLLGPFAWKMGNAAIAEMDARPDVTYTNRGNINAGRICGIIGSAFLALGALMFVLFLLLVVLGAAAG